MKRVSRSPTTESFKRALRFNTSVRLWLIVCCSLVAVACAGDECQRGETKCDNGVAKVCFDSEEMFGSFRHWGGDQECGEPDLCVLTKASGAFCVLAPNPDPACIAIEQQNATCSADGLTLLYCRDGYIVKRGACPSCTKLPSGKVECRQTPDQ